MPVNTLRPSSPWPDVDEGQDLRAHDAAEAEAVVPVQVADRVRRHALEHLPGVDEWRELELGLHAEEAVLVDVGAKLQGADAAVEPDEAVAAVASQRVPAAEGAALPEGRVARPADVVERPRASR